LRERERGREKRERESVLREEKGRGAIIMVFGVNLADTRIITWGGLVSLTP
jgi:hypothetical protein